MARAGVIGILLEELAAPAKALLVPELDALLDEGADLAICKRGGAQLDAEAAPLDELLAPEQHTTRPLWRRCGESKLRGSC